MIKCEKCDKETVGYGGMCLSCYMAFTKPKAPASEGLEWKFHIFMPGGSSPGEWRLHQATWPCVEV